MCVMYLIHSASIKAQQNLTRKFFHIFSTCKKMTKVEHNVTLTLIHNESLHKATITC